MTEFLGAQDEAEAERAEGLAPTPLIPSPELRVVRAAWVLMGETLDWHALPVAVEVLGVHDPEWLITGLCAVRDHFAAK